MTFTSLRPVVLCLAPLYGGNQVNMERHTASTITDDDLDRLYEELERLREIEWMYEQLRD